MKRFLTMLSTLAASSLLAMPASADGIPFRVETLEDFVQEIETNLGEASASVLTNSEQLEALQTSQGALELRVDDLESVLSTLPRRYIFVTSQSFSGNLGGLDGADAKCQSAAAEAGLEGLYLAWLSIASGPLIGQPSSGPLHRFVRHAVPYLRPDGVLVADHFGDLVDGSLDNPVSADEYGSTVFEGTTWSGTSSNGSPVVTGSPFANTCGNWTTDEFLSSATFFGTIGAVDYTWSSPGVGIATPCTEHRRLICVQQ